jgi:hypothetical protein
MLSAARPQRAEQLGVASRAPPAPAPTGRRGGRRRRRAAQPSKRRGVLEQRASPPARRRAGSRRPPPGSPAPRQRRRVSAPPRRTAGRPDRARIFMPPRSGGPAVGRSASSSPSSSPIRRWCSSSRSLWLARFTISRAEEANTVSTTTSPFSSSVRPVSTRSRIQSERPSSGAISTEPLIRISSTWMPRSAKKRRATPRTWWRRAAPPPARSGYGTPAGAATARRQRPKPRSSGCSTSARAPQHVQPDHAEVGDARLHVGRHVLVLDRQELEAPVRRRQDQPPGLQRPPARCRSRAGPEPSASSIIRPLGSATRSGRRLTGPPARSSSASASVSSAKPTAGRSAPYSASSWS